MNHYLLQAVIKIKKALQLGQTQVDCPQSRLVLNVLDILWQEKLIEGYQVNQDRVVIKFVFDAKQRVRSFDLKVLSPPQIDIKHDVKQLKKKASLLPKYGFFIVTTSQGMMTSCHAVHLHLGGRILCVVS